MTALRRTALFVALAALSLSAPAFARAGDCRCESHGYPATVRVQSFDGGERWSETGGGWSKERLRGERRHWSGNRVDDRYSGGGHYRAEASNRAEDGYLAEDGYRDDGRYRDDERYRAQDGYRGDGRIRGGYVAEDGYRDEGRHDRDDRHRAENGDLDGNGAFAEDDSVGYLPLSFFGDAGGVGPYPADFDYGGGGGYGFAGGSTGAFAGARASASVSVSARAFGGFRGHFGGRGGYHGGGGHGCGCK